MREISYQLYSSRKFPPLEDTLRMLSDVGFSFVEGFGALYPTVDEARALRDQLDAVGLNMPTAHVGLTQIEETPQTVIAAARILGIDLVIAPYLDARERPHTVDGWSAIGSRLAEGGKPLRDAGLRLGWHNHDFEFATLEGGGTPLDCLTEADPDLWLELDLGWAQVARQDVIGVITRHQDRLAAVHLKDVAPAGTLRDEDGWADLGHGIMDWPALLDALAPCPLRALVLEHDNPKDHRRFAERSLATVRSLV